MNSAGHAELVVYEKRASFVCSRKYTANVWLLPTNRFAGHGLRQYLNAIRQRPYLISNRSSIRENLLPSLPFFFQMEIELFGQNR